METIQDYGWWITAGLIIVGALVMIFGAKYIAKVGYRNAKQGIEYDRKYLRIQNLINECNANEQNYTWLCTLITHLRELPYKNIERTDSLDIEFRTKFEVWVKANKEVI